MWVRRTKKKEVMALISVGEWRRTSRRRRKEEVSVGGKRIEPVWNVYISTGR